MVSSFADWICNVLVWGGIVLVAALLYEVFVAPGSLTGSSASIAALVGVAVVAVLSALWPKY
jgi:hypothetical protein